MDDGFAAMCSCAHFAEEDAALCAEELDAEEAAAFARIHGGEWLEVFEAMWERCLFPRRWARAGGRCRGWCRLGGRVCGAAF